METDVGFMIFDWPVFWTAAIGGLFGGATVVWLTAAMIAYIDWKAKRGKM